jgi:DNA primase
MYRSSFYNIGGDWKMAEKQKIKYNKGVINLDKIKQELNEIGLDRVFEWYGIDIKGKNAINCVFHDENTPSQKIYSKDGYDRNMWHCFGECSTGGDGFYFILKQEKDFFKAVQVASDITGIEAEMNHSAETQLIMSKIEQFNYKLNWEEFAPYAYRHSLEGETTPFEQFLEERCISIETARRYGLGYADEKGYGEFALDVGLELGLITETEEGFNADELIETGLFRRSDKGEEKGMFPTLLNCITIPIHDDKGNIVGFEGRRLDKDDVDKYGKYNKSATKFFLFNSDVIDRYEDVHLFEGAIDTLTAIQCGFPNSIGLLGVSSLGAEEKAVLSRVKGKIFIHMDDDSAGQTKADELLQELGHKAYKAKPLGFDGTIKDINEYFVSTFNGFKSK